jgi:hypothetical protein
LKSVKERLVLARGALFAYPIVAIVAVITFLAGDVHWSTTSFLISGLLYPIVYCVALDLALAFQSRGHAAASLRISSAPLWYLAVVFGLAIVALLFDVE